MQIHVIFHFRKPIDLFVWTDVVPEPSTSTQRPRWWNATKEEAFVPHEFRAKRILRSEHACWKNGLRGQQELQAEQQLGFIHEAVFSPQDFKTCIRSSSNVLG